MNIEVKDIKSIYSTTMFNRGMSYFKQGLVKNLSYDHDEGMWYAKVLGSELYEIEIAIKNTKIHSYCDCPAFDKYGECKHEVAVLLEIAHKNEKIDHDTHLKELQREKTNRFMTIFSNYRQGHSTENQIVMKKPLQIEFIMKVSNPYYSLHHLLLALEIKVGVERTYVVRNIKEFLLKVKNRIPHEFTKKFTYDPEEHYFLEPDAEIIQLLFDVLANQMLYEPSDSYYWQSTENERQLTIPLLLAVPLLTKLKDRNFSFEDEEYVYRQIELSNEKLLPISFQLNKNEQDECYLNFAELHHLTYFEQYGMVFYEGVFYQPTEDQMLLLKDLMQFQKLDSTQQLPISQDQISPFLSNVLPGLKKIAKVEVTEEISDQIIQPSLQSKIYIDQNDEMINMRIEYHYDQFMINPFEKDKENIQENGVILVRDLEHENEIMAIIEHSPLRFNGKQLFMEDDDDSLYVFIFDILPKLENVAEVYLSGSVKSYFHSTTYTPVTSIDIETSGSLLDVNFDINGINQDEVNKVLQSVVEKKRYYRLPNGAFVSLESAEFERIGELFGELKISSKQLGEGPIKIPLYRGLQVSDIMQTGNRFTTRLGKAFKKLVQDLKSPEELEFDLPTNLHAHLRDYQTIGYQWFKSLGYYHLGGVLADDMGLGKTLQSISYILSECEQGDGKSFLIVAPASLIYNWKSEIEKFAPMLHAEVISGTPTERAEFFKKSEEHPEIIITSYPTLRQDIDHYKEIKFDTMILDEAQAIKNYATKTSAAVRTVNAAKRFALSGTPIENSIDELWALFQAILPGFFPAQTEFRKLSQEKVSQMIRPFILRRLKKDVLKELPDKIETNHLSELTKEQKELYLAYLEKIQNEAVQTIADGGFNKNRIKILAGLTRLRQLCCHPTLFLDNYEGKSGKLEQLVDITKTAKENGKRLLIFSQFASMLRVMRMRLEKEGFNCFYLDGQTPSKERVDMANQFNSGENDLFLISLKAGGTGLNLTGADTVILYDLWWNPAVEEQAAGRAHRIGQKNVVQVIRLMARGTIEEKIYELQQKKKELIERVIQPGETMLNSLSEQEIRELLSI